MRILEARNMIKKGVVAAIAVAICLFAITLTGCGGSDSTKSASEPIAASQAFGQEGVWVQYDDDEAIDKDGKIDRVLVFDGNGNVTAYTCNGLTFGDLNGLSDDEIIDKAKEEDKASFEAKKQDAIDAMSELLETGNSNSERLQEEYANGEWRGEDGTYETVMANFNAQISEIEKAQTTTKNSEYQEPQPQSYSLKLSTDSSGNNADGEELTFSVSSPSFATFDGDVLDVSVVNLKYYASPEFELESADDVDMNASKNETLELQPTGNQTVYDTVFAGFSGLATVVDEGHAGFMWDAPNAEGIEVD